MNFSITGTLEESTSAWLPSLVHNVCSTSHHYAQIPISGKARNSPEENNSEATHSPAAYVPLAKIWLYSCKGGWGRGRGQGSISSSKSQPSDLTAFQDRLQWGRKLFWESTPSWFPIGSSSNRLCLDGAQACRTLITIFLPLALA